MVFKCDDRNSLSYIDIKKMEHSISKSLFHTALLLEDGLRKPHTKENLAQMRREEASAIPSQVEQFSEKLDCIFLETFTNKAKPFSGTWVLDEAIRVNHTHISYVRGKVAKV